MSQAASHLMRALFYFLPLLLFAAACDLSGSDASSETHFHERIYRTPLTDRATGATVLDNGHLAVYGLTEGRIAPADGTNAFPLLLRMQPNGTIADKAVYRDGGYGEIAGAVALNNGIATLTNIRNAGASGVGTPTLTLYRTTLGGTRTDVLYAQSNASAPEHPLLRTPDGGLLLIMFPFEADAHDLVKLSATGTVEWTYQMSDAQDVRAASITSNGHLLVLGAVDAYQFTVARLTSTGREQWRRTYGDESVVRQIRGFSAVGNGAAILTDHLDAGSTTIHLTRLSETGDIQWERSYATGSHTTGSVDATALAALGDDELAFAWTEDLTPQQIGGRRAEIVRVNLRGEVLSRHPFGPQQNATTTVSDLLPYPPKSFVAVGSTGPERLGGYGGDDFDVLVKRYHRPQ